MTIAGAFNVALWKKTLKGYLLSSKR